MLSSVSRFPFLFPFFPPRAHPVRVVFDKDGTLGNDRESLRRWAVEMTSRTRKYMTAAINKRRFCQSGANNIDNIIANIHCAIGWDHVNEKLLPSALLAAGTWEEILTVFASAIAHNKKIAAGDACVHVENIQKMVLGWHNDIGTLHAEDEPVVNDLRGLMLECKQFGLKIAVCTSDDRRSTNLALSRWGVDGLVDVSFSTCIIYTWVLLLKLFSYMFCST